MLALNNIKKEDEMLVQFKIVQLNKDLEQIEYYVKDIASTIDNTKRLLKDYVTDTSESKNNLFEEE